MHGDREYVIIITALINVTISVHAYTSTTLRGFDTERI